MEPDKEKKTVTVKGLTVEIDTANIVKKCRAITKHLTALADELENIDKTAGE